MLRPAAAFLVLLGTPLLAQNGWVQRSTAVAPSNRGWHGLAYDVGRGVHVLFGGYGFGVALGDTWEWDGAVWSQRTPAVSPSARSVHTMAADLIRGNVLLFGGLDARVSLLADTWTYDGAGWVRRLPAHAPSPRAGAGLAYLGNGGQMILHGGEGAGNPTTLGDTWSWNGVDWSAVATLQSPGPRSGFGITSDFSHGSVVLFGGTAAGQVDFADAWSFDGIDWRLLPATQTPQALVNTVLAADLGRGILVQFGGYQSANNLPPTDETWLYDGFDWRRDQRATAMTARRAFGVSYDWVRDCFVLFGGFANQYLGETWEYDLRGAATWASLGAGCTGLAIAPELRPIGARAVLGATSSQQVTGGVSGGVVFAVGFSSQSWNGAPLPQSLAGYGMPGCQLQIAPEQMVFRASQGGVARLDVPIPAVPSLAGVELFTQALVFQPGVNPFGAVVSNGSRMVVGTF